MLNVKIKKLVPFASIPKYAHPGDAGMDVTAVSMEVTDDYIEYCTGLAFEIPKGYAMLIFPRSSVSKYDLSLANAVGILDSSYRGELKLRFKRQYRAYDDFSFKTQNMVNAKSTNLCLECTKMYEPGNAVCQIMIIPYPEVTFEEVDELSQTERGIGGFGSSGK